MVGAVSKMLQASGDRVKTDRRDATFLARMLAVGNIVEVAMPTEAMAARDLARAREDCRHDLMRAGTCSRSSCSGKDRVSRKDRMDEAHREMARQARIRGPCERLVFGNTSKSVRSLELAQAQGSTGP